MTVVAIVALIAFFCAGYGLRVLIEKRAQYRLAGGSGNDALLRECELEVEALLSGVPVEEQKKKRQALLPPPKRVKHPRLTEMQRRAIAGLYADGFSSDSITNMPVESVEPPRKDSRATSHLWVGLVYTFTGKPADGSWGEARVISNETWSYLRRVIDVRPDRGHSWVFQYADGKQVDHADVITCVGDEPEGE